MEDKLNKKFESLLEAIREYNNEVDAETIRAAFEFAKIAHAGEKRLSGTAVIFHPLETSIILASWKMDQTTIIAGLLHDTIEHGAATKKDILDAFGEEVKFLVEGITNTSNLRLRSSEEEVFIENLRKMFLAVSKDLRIVFLRLAERIDNLKTLNYLPEDQRVRYAKESIEIYSPLAERLGMWDAKTEIDDLAFRYVHPAEYTKIKSLSAKAYEDSEKSIEKMKKSITVKLVKQGIKDAKVFGRKKSLYSLFNKLGRPEVGGEIAKIHDIVALRILLTTVSDCYVALGVVHDMFKPVPHLALSDFIAVPKPNGYRSIHTKVYGPAGKIVEVQIRTFEMHEQAEYGVAAHWAYSEAKNKGVSGKVINETGVFANSQKLSWVKQLAEWQKEVKDNEEFLKAVKFDALSRRIFVFSPKGDVFDLPVNATPIDYAYSVHTDLGNYIKGAIVDGRIVHLNYKLRSGEVVEILKSKNPTKPNDDWLEFAMTTLAKREIKKQLKKFPDDRKN